MKYNCYILLRYRTGVRLCPLKNNVTYKCLSNKTTRISNEKRFLQYFTIISVFFLVSYKTSADDKSCDLWRPPLCSHKQNDESRESV